VIRIQPKSVTTHLLNILRRLYTEGMMRKFIPLAVICFVSIISYIVSFALPALTLYSDMSGYQTWPGWQCAYLGMFSCFAGHFEPLANFFYLGAIILLLIPIDEKYLLATFFSGIALFLGLETLILFIFPVVIPDSPSGNILTRLEIGYYLWMLSFLLIFFFSFFNYQQGKKVTLP
jgi:hypothetical protein